MKIILILLLALNLYSQDADLDKLPYDDTPNQNENINYFVIGGGYTIGFYNLNTQEYNKLLENNFGIKDGFSNGMFMHGGVGFTGLPIFKNIRVGIHSFGGNSVMNSVQEDYNLEQSLNLSMTGVNFDYGYIIIDHLAIVPGIGLGWGNTNLSLSKGNNNVDWGGINPDISDSSYHYSFDKRFMYIAPTVSVEWAATSFLMFRFLVNYNLSFDNPFSSQEDQAWRLNNISNISNVPNDLTNSAIYLEFGVFLGLFNY